MRVIMYAKLLVSKLGLGYSIRLEGVWSIFYEIYPSQVLINSAISVIILPIENFLIHFTITIIVSTVSWPRSRPSALEIF